MAEQAATVVNEEVTTGATTTESAPVETQNPVTAENAFDDDAFDDIDAEVAAGETDSEEDTTEESQDNTEESTQTEETETEQPQEGEKPLTEKSQNRFQQLANRNKELEEENARLKSQGTQVATEQNLLNEVNPDTGDYYTPAEAEREARKQALQQSQQEIERKTFMLEVQQSQENISRESQQVLKDFPMFDEESKEYNPQIAAQFDSIIAKNLMYMLPDGSRYPASVLAANGIDLRQATLLGSNTSPYELAKLIADSTKANAGLYEANAQRSTERMLANADTLGGNTHANSYKDADLDDFDRGWND